MKKEPSFFTTRTIVQTLLLTFFLGNTYANVSDYSTVEKSIVNVQTDEDKDGIDDSVDVCPNTPEGEKVDQNGCSEKQKIG